MPEQLSRLYSELTTWFHMLSAPADYAEEAEFYRRVFVEASAPPRTLLELGSGGGNMASHYKEDGKPMRCEYDRHVCGVFGRDDWLHLLAEVGFTATVRPLEHIAVPSGSTAIFVASKSAHLAG